MENTFNTASEVYTWYLHEGLKIDARYAHERRSITAKWKENRLERSQLHAQLRDIDRGKIDVVAGKYGEIATRIAVLDGEEQELLDSKDELKESYSRNKAALQNQKEQLLKTLKK